MRRFQRAMGMLIAVFTLAGVMTVGMSMTGCKKEETTGDKIDNAMDKAQDNADKAADEMKDAADKAKEAADDAMNGG